MHKSLQLVLLSTALFTPSLFANKGRKAAILFAKGVFSPSQPIGLRAARITPERRATHTGSIATSAERSAHSRKSLDQPSHCSIITFPLCSPTTRENPTLPQDFEKYKSRRGTFAYFIATIKVKESLPGENVTRERVMIFYDNAGAQMVIKTANKLIAECPRVLNATVSWQMAEYDIQNNENKDLDELD
jgi:hypothetical protein